MKYKKIIILFLAIFIMTGCKSKSSDVIISDDVVANRDTGSILTKLSSSKDRLPSTVGASPLLKNQISDTSFISKDGNYRDVTIIDSTLWTTYSNSDYGFEITYPSDYIIFEESVGEFIFTGEGVGDFYKIRIGDSSVPPEGELKSRSSVGINGFSFVTEEYEGDFDSQTIIYYAKNGGLVYQMEYTFFSEGFEDFIDLYIKSAQTFRFL